MSKFILSVTFRSSGSHDNSNQLVGVFEKDDIFLAKSDWKTENREYWADYGNGDVGYIVKWQVTPIGENGKVTDYPLFQDP